jgi:hypothetical protein
VSLGLGKLQASQSSCVGAAFRRVAWQPVSAAPSPPPSPLLALPHSKHDPPAIQPHSPLLCSITHTHIHVERLFTLPGVLLRCEERRTRTTEITPSGGDFPAETLREEGNKHLPFVLRRTNPSLRHQRRPALRTSRRKRGAVEDVWALRCSRRRYTPPFVKSPSPLYSGFRHRFHRTTITLHHDRGEWTAADGIDHTLDFLPCDWRILAIAGSALEPPDRPPIDCCITCSITTLPVFGTTVSSSHLLAPPKSGRRTEAQPCGR